MAQWIIIKNENMVKTPMHLLGHCIVGSLVTDFLEQVMTHLYLLTVFKDFANPILENIGFFRLDWYKVKTLLKANWLSKDCFGFTRVMLYLVVLFLEEYSLADIRNNTKESRLLLLLRYYIPSLQ